MLDLTPFRNAVAQLGQGLKDYEQHPDMQIVRDGIIQRFEFTYELSHKMLRRYLIETEASGITKDMSFANLVRLASDRGLLLNDWTVWQAYRDARNQTSHGYDEEKAKAVFSIIPAFLTDASYLLDQLAKRLNA